MLVNNREVYHGFLGLMLTTLFGTLVHAIEPTDDETKNSSEDLFKDSNTDPTLALPSQSGRKPLNVENSRPSQSQPQREKLTTAARSGARTTQQVIPGRPGRNLELPSTVEEANESSCDSLEEPVEPILWIIPRELRGGGITLECIYTGETFTKAKGGINPGRPTNYRSNLDIVAIADTGKLGWWDRGRLFVYGQNLSGRPLSESEVGDVQLFSNLDSTIGPGQRPQFTAISEYWFEQFFMDDILSFRIGKQDTNAIFALTDLGGSLCIRPLVPHLSFQCRRFPAMHLVYLLF